MARFFVRAIGLWAIYWALALGFRHFAGPILTFAEAFHLLVGGVLMFGAFLAVCPWRGDNEDG